MYVWLVRAKYQGAHPQVHAIGSFSFVLCDGTQIDSMSRHEDLMQTIPNDLAEATSWVAEDSNLIDHWYPDTTEATNSFAHLRWGH